MARQTLLFGGDLTLGAAPGFFDTLAPLFDAADFRMAQLEEPFLDQLIENATADCLTANLDPLVGKLDLVTLSGNHFRDFGDIGIRDTLNWCNRHGIAYCGGGLDRESAHRPAFVEKDGTKIGVLAYNAIGSKKNFVGDDHGGTSYVNFIRGYVPVSMLDQEGTRLENDVWELKKPIRIDEDCMGFNFVDPESCMAMAQAVYEAKQQCDILLVYFHKGYVHRPVTVDAWERFLSHIAIDNGADAVMASHSHIAHGVELYKGKAIYHGLNNLVMYTPQLSPNFKGVVHGGKESNNAEWVKSRIERFGFVPDPDYPTYPFHPDSVYCPVAKLVIENGRIDSYRMLLMKVEKDGIPYPHGRDAIGQEVFDYMQRITDEAGLNAALRWDGDEVLIT